MHLQLLHFDLSNYTTVVQEILQDPLQHPFDPSMPVWSVKLPKFT